MADTHTSECNPTNAIDTMFGRVTYPTGAVRSDCVEGVRFDLISPIATERCARTMWEGSVKYGDRNWELGFPASVLVNHAMNHLNKWLAGDCTEDHLAHAVFNIHAIMHQEHTRPDLMDIPSRQTRLVPPPEPDQAPPARRRDARTVG